MSLVFVHPISFCPSVSVSFLNPLTPCLAASYPKKYCWKQCFAKKQKEAICLSFSAPSLSLDDLFDCIAALGSSFRRFGQRKPCHNSEFLTRLQLPGRATVDQRWINTRDKLRQSHA